MTRVLPMVLAFLFVAAACGGESGDSAVDSSVQSSATETTVIDEASGGATSPGPDASASSTPMADDDVASDGSGPSTATVTLGDATYTFSSEGAVVAQCKTDLFGIFSLQLPMVDGEGGIQIIVLHDDTDPSVVEQVNAVLVSVGDEDWVADEASDLFEASETLEEGMSQVDSAEMSGRMVRGTATFVRQLSVFMGEEETMTGTFEATCGEERLS